MKFLIVFALVAAAAAQISNEYLPPNAGEASYSVETVEAAPSVSYSAPAVSHETFEVAAAAPAHTFSDADGYRYKTQRRRVVRRQRRDVSSEYLPPVASQAVEEVAYSAPAESYETEAATPAHSFSDADGYRYKTLRRRVVRRQRRDVSSEYLPPVASQAVEEVAYSAPAATYESYETEAATPAHSFSDVDGYRYKTQRRRVVRRQRRDVSSEYLPPVASQAVEEVAYSAPAATETYETEAAAPAHSFSDADGYRYKTHRRVVVRRQRRDVSSEYLPPVASQAVEEVAFSAPAATETYKTEAATPAHSFSDADGYRYKTHRRVVVRRQRRDVSSEYLPPVASQAVEEVAYSAPAAAETYETEAAAPAHSFSDADGYRYKTHRRVVLRRNRF